MNKWTAFSAIALSLLTGTCKADDFDSLLLFGDSYFDTGAGNAIATAEGIPLPNPTPPYFNGRHSNGPIWIDFTQRLLKVPSVDFGVAGSETGSGNVFNPALGGIATQILRYELTQPPISSNTIVIMDGGGNDYLALLSTPSMLNPAGIAATTQTALTNQAVNLLTLEALGAKRIIIWNLGDLGMLPLFTDPALGLTILQPLFSAASVAYNTNLPPLIRQLNATGPNHKTIIIFPAFDVFNEIAAKLAAEGINLTEHTITTLPGGGFIVTGPQPEQLAFYDQVHPTTLVWRMFANYQSAFIDSVVNGPRFMAAEQDVIFETARAFRDAMDNHYRTLHLQRFVQCHDWNQCCSELERFQIYTDGLAKWGSTHSRSGTLGFNYDTQLALLGVDYHYNDCWTFGANFTAQRNYAHMRRHHGNLQLNDYIPTIYTEFSRCNFFVDSNISYHIYDFRRIHRKIPFLDRTARARTHGQGVEANVEAGYVMPCYCSTFIPIVGLDYVYAHINEYREKHAGFLNLRVHKQHNDSLIGKVGGQMFWNPFECGIISFGEIYFEQEFLRHRRTISPRRIGSRDGSKFFNRTSSPDRSILKYAFGFDAEITPCISGNISYQGETTFRKYNNAVRAELLANF